MKSAYLVAAIILAVLIGSPRASRAQSAQSLPIPSVDAATDFPGEHELPDPNLVYKIAFDVAKASPKIDDVNPGLIAIARYFNTLAKGGVPADHRKFVVVFHQQGTPLAMNNAAFKARNDGRDNPNIALIHSMKTAGVDFRVCGQGVLSQKIDMDAILPDVQIDQWAMTTLTNLALRGYVRVGGL